MKTAFRMMRNAVFLLRRNFLEKFSPLEGIRLKVMDDSWTLMAGEKAGELYFVNMNSAAITGLDGGTMTVNGLKAGMAVDVAYDGTVRLSDPMQITADKVQVAEQVDDLVGFDFSTLTNLTDGEREALKYLISCDLGPGQKVSKKARQHSI